jgi:HK97 family phage major capsid protein
MSKIAERIEAAQNALTAKKDQLSLLVKSMEANPTDDTIIAQVDSLSAEIESETKSIAALQKAELALASSHNNQAPNVHTNGPGKVKDASDLIVKNAVCTMEAYLKRIPLAQAMQERYGNTREFEQVKAVSDYMVQKAAQNPAMTNVPGWAAELVRESYGAFMDLISPESVVPRLPMQRYSFDGFGKITIGTRKDKTKNLAGAFRAEGAPIRVGAAVTGSLALTPKSLGVIGTFTNELFARSTPNIEQAIRNWIIEDTAEALDKTFLDAVAGSAIRPAGIQNGIAGGNTGASAGDTSADITADIRARLQAMANASLGRRIVFVMNTARFIGVKLALTPTGTLAFPEASNGQLLGYPVITSVNVPADVVFVIDAAELAFAGDAPSFMGTEVATIHEEDTAPLPIVDNAGTPVVAHPVRSLFQTNSSALRALWEIDWHVARAGAVQTITAAAW